MFMALFNILFPEDPATFVCRNVGHLFIIIDSMFPRG